MKGTVFHMEEKKIIVSAITGVIATFFKAYIAIILCVCFAIVFDIVSGIISSKATGTPITPERGTQGFYKKVGLLVTLFFGMFLDVFIPLTCGYINIKIPIQMPFGLIIGSYIVLNESLSICVNLDKSNPNILPRWVKSMLQGVSKNIESKGE